MVIFINFLYFCRCRIKARHASHLFQRFTLVFQNCLFPLVLEFIMAEKGKKRNILLLSLAAIAIVACICIVSFKPGKGGNSILHYDEILYPTQNYSRAIANDVEGVILHHTALPTLQRSLDMLTLPQNIVSTHCVIDTDGTRYILADPGIVTFHAGKSILNGRERCNEFTIGVEFQGNTQEKPLTVNQIRSAVEYLVPIIREHKIPIANVVTHEMIRTNYMKAHPEDTIVKDKCDITKPEYERVMEALTPYIGSDSQ